MTDERSLEAIVEEMVADGKLSRDELKRFEARMLSDGQLSVSERRTIDKLLQMIANGELVVVD